MSYKKARIHFDCGLFVFACAKVGELVVKIFTRRFARNKASSALCQYSR